MPPPKTLSRSANEFAVDLFQCYLRRHGDKYINLLLCPYLIYQSLAMMLVGARGQTSQQLMNLLHIKPVVAATTPAPPTQPETALALAEQQRHRDFLWLAEQLIHGNHDFVHLASFIYLDKSIKRTEDFKNILRDYYETKPKKIEFGDVDSTVQTINEDVARTTENIYSDILSKQEAQKLEKSMLSVNAVFFRGFWLSNFTEVARAPFQRNGPKDLRPSTVATMKTITGVGQKSLGSSNKSSGIKGLPPVSPCTTLGPSDFATSMHTISMMSKLDYLAIVADEQLDARIIKMPFEASDLQMVVILPNERTSNSAYLCERMTAAKLDQIINEFRRVKPTTVKVTMPVFCIDSGKISIQSTLITMGASDLFDKSRANLSGLCAQKDQPVWLNKIIHRCFIVCDNRGSITSSTFEKARKSHASSLKKDGSLSMQKLTGVEEFTADHPFMYIIMDSITHTILLLGLYTDPSETLEVIHENQLSSEEAHQLYSEGVYRT